MKLRLCHFRSWTNLCLDINLGAITLIKGNSGTGKTTILQAIAWCLYGNLRKVSPLNNPTAKTRVEISLPYIKVVRSKYPNRLIVKQYHDNRTIANTFEDKVAQSLVNETFGSFDIWLASCYISQKCHNNFLSASNISKMELLNIIAFHEEDPSYYIGKINEALVQTEHTYKTAQEVLEKELCIYNTSFADIDVGDVLTQEDSSTLERNLESMNVSRTNMLQIQQKNSVTQGIVDNLVSQRENIIMPSPPIPDPLYLMLTEKYNRFSLEDTLPIIAMIDKRDELAKEVSRLAAIVLSHDHTQSYSLDDYNRALYQENKYQDNKRLATLLGVVYDENAIVTTINSKRQLLESQARLTIELEYRSVQNKLSELSGKTFELLPIPALESITVPEPDYSVFSNKELKKKLSSLESEHAANVSHIKHMESGKNVVKCPGCHVNLISKNNVLQISDNGPVDNKELCDVREKLQSLSDERIALAQKIRGNKQEKEKIALTYKQKCTAEQQRIEQLNNNVWAIKLENSKRELAEQQCSEQIELLKSKLGELLRQLGSVPERNNKNLLTANEIDNIKIVISRLSNIEVISLPPVSSAGIQLWLKHCDEKKRHDELTETYQELCQRIPDVFKKLSMEDVKEYLSVIRFHERNERIVLEEKTRVEHMINTLDHQLESLNKGLAPDPSHDILLLEKAIAEHKNVLEASRLANIAVDQIQKIGAAKDELSRITDDFNDIQMLKQVAITTECEQLQRATESINTSIQTVCENLFANDVSAQINLFKTNKVSKSTKPMVNLDIYYKGMTYESISDMSGGEADRLSFAVTLAFNLLSPCPVLMLDETFAYLDLDTKEMAIQCIRDLYNIQSDNPNSMQCILVAMHVGVEGIFDHVVDLDEMER